MDAKKGLVMVQSDPFAQIGAPAGRRAGGGLLAPLVWLGGMISTALAVTVGAVLAILTAAAVAVIALIAGIVVFFAGSAMRAKRARQARARRDEGVIDAQKVGDTWVTYGWEREGR